MVIEEYALLPDNTLYFYDYIIADTVSALVKSTLVRQTGIRANRISNSLV